MHVSRILAIATSSMLICCSEPTSATTAASVSGTWAMPESIPGNSFEMTLAANGSSLSGTGKFAGEAGPAGTLTVTGSVSNDVVNLDFVLQTSFPDHAVTSTEHFTGRLISLELRGTMQSGVASPSNPPVTAVFVREH